MKQRYFSLVLSVVALFLSAGVLYVYGQTYESPTLPFPQGLKNVPVDTGDIGQPKGNFIAPTQIDFTKNTSPSTLGIILGAGQIIQSGSNSINPNAGSGWALINAQGLVIPKLSASPTAAEGMIYYDTTGKKVKLYNGTAWTDIGTGSPSGASFWVKGTGTEIYYDGGDVYVGSVDSVPVKYYPTGNVVTAFNNNSNQYSFVKNAFAANVPSGNKLKCDTSPIYFDCPVPYTPQAGDSQTLGAFGYDAAYTCSKYGFDYSLEGSNCIKYYSCGGPDTVSTCVADTKPAVTEYREFILTRQGASSGKLIAGKIVFSGSNVVRSSEFGYGYNTPTGNAQNTITLGEYSFCALGKVSHDGGNGGWCDVSYDGTNWKLNYGKWGNGGIGCRVNCF